MNELRVPLIRDALVSARQDASDCKIKATHPLEGNTILDVGSGGGILTEVNIVAFKVKVYIYILFMWLHPTKKLSSSLDAMSRLVERLRLASIYFRHIPLYKTSHHLRYISACFYLSENI